jgi:hypothetical protein
VWRREQVRVLAPYTVPQEFSVELMRSRSLQRRLRRRRRVYHSASTLEQRARRYRWHREDALTKTRNVRRRQSKASADDAEDELVDHLTVAVSFESLTGTYQEEVSRMLRWYGRSAQALAQVLIQHPEVSTVVMIEGFPLAVIACIPYATYADILPRTRFPQTETAWLVWGTLCLNFPIALLPQLWRVVHDDQANACATAGSQAGDPLFKRAASRFVHIGFAERRASDVSSAAQSPQGASRMTTHAPRQLRIKQRRSNREAAMEWSFPSVADQMLYENASDAVCLSLDSGFHVHEELVPIAMLIDAEDLLRVGRQLEQHSPHQVKEH